MKVYELIDFMEKIAPCGLCEEWDNVGLMIGNREAEIKRIMVSLDLDDAVMKEALENKVDMILTHHPVIFKPLKKIDNDIYTLAIKNDISVYSAHTNLDAAVGGVNDVLASVLKLSDIEPNGMMRIGRTKDIKLFDFVKIIKEKLNVKSVRVCGDPDMLISKVAVLGGSGGDFVYELDKSLCDVYVTGEASYHQAYYAKEKGFALIAAGHFETENHIVADVVKRLKENFNVEILASSQKNVYNTI